MARQLRLEYPGALYHITSRGNLKEKIFFHDQDRERFLDILKRTKERYGYLLHAYTLMDNHYHLIIETPFSNVKQIMQNINTSYTVYINKKYERSGHLFQGRYKAVIVDKDNYLLELSRYIHLNPVRAKLVKSPDQYRWTSYKDYMATKRSNLVDIEDTLSYFSNHKQKAIRAYRRFVKSAVSKEIPSPFDDLDARIILGKGDFKQKIMDFLRDIKDDSELPALRRIKKILPDKIIQSVAEFYGIKVDDLVYRGKRQKERNFAIYLTKMLSHAKNVEVGHHFHIKGPAVSNVLKMVEGEINSSKEVKSEIEELRQRILDAQK